MIDFCQRYDLSICKFEYPMGPVRIMNKTVNECQHSRLALLALLCTICSVLISGIVSAGELVREVLPTNTSNLFKRNRRSAPHRRVYICYGR